MIVIGNIMRKELYFLFRSAKMFHPVFATVDPSISVGCGVKAGVFVHATVEKMLNVE